jgi:hypothetical protein
MDFTGIADLVAIFKKHPKVRDEIQNQLQQWTFAGANDANGQRLRDSVANGLPQSSLLDRQSEFSEKLRERLLAC